MTTYAMPDAVRHRTGDHTMTDPTTLADVAHTCRDNAAALIRIADGWDRLGETGAAGVDRDDAADLEALAVLCDRISRLSYNAGRDEQNVAAANRLAARLRLGADQ